jgi:hypothetical protein
MPDVDATVDDGDFDAHAGALYACLVPCVDGPIDDGCPVQGHVYGADGQNAPYTGKGGDRGDAAVGNVDEKRVAHDPGDGKDRAVDLDPAPELFVLAANSVAVGDCLRGVQVGAGRSPGDVLGNWAGVYLDDVVSGDDGSGQHDCQEKEGEAEAQTGKTAMR